MKKKVIVLVIIGAVIVGIVALNISAKNRNKFVSVKTSKAVTSDVKSYLSTTATIKSKNSKDYYGPQAKVSAVNVKVGDKVKKGQVLITYEVQDLTAAVKQAQISLSTAQSQKQDLSNTVVNNNQKLTDTNNQITDITNQLNSANSTLAALKNSVKPDQAKITTETQAVQQLNTQLTTLNNTKNQYSIDETEKLKQADNAISLAQVNLNTANLNLSRSVNSITADFDGVVTALNASIGQTSAGAQAAITVQDIDSLEAEVNVDKYSASQLKIGQTATITYANKEYNGNITYIAPATTVTTSTTGQTATLTADIDVTNATEDLKIGFDADANILVGEADKVLNIPAESVKTDKTGKNYVFVVLGNKAIEKDIQLGLQSDVSAQVISGLSAGDKVILNPGTTVSNGTYVKESSSSK